MWKLGVTPQFIVVHAHKLVHLCVNHSTSVHTEGVWSDADVNIFPSFCIFAYFTCSAYCLNGGSHGNRDLGPDGFYTNPQYTLLSRAAGALKGLSSSALSRED